ncbi:putative Basic helix-loop-helix DNA-binding superfamily protein [Hibiscus syriacus]|uniref:Basic helix-loop-helix DNA-binding superfamily protein n=1 Tax=Hibiscus syriacus TaxID=106335 RepID=A0A6A2Z1T3_HIBSY|nr:putative Basic helix-loop-helix DNA-binding superfamily protein [Hibiscus syriacus]
MAVRLLSTPTALSHPAKLFFIPSPKQVPSFNGDPSAEYFLTWTVYCAIVRTLPGRQLLMFFAEMGVQCTAEDLAPFTGMGEANFLGGVAAVKGVKEFDTEAAKKRFFEIYLDKYAKPNSGIGFPGALELITQCQNKGLKVGVASSADRVKVDANLAASGLPISMFDAIVSADAFENLKPAPDIFLAASKILDISPEECIVIEDAVAGVQAANAANMRCIAVTTTLTEEALKAVGPSFIRNDIGSVLLDDTLSGGSVLNERTYNGSTLGVDVPSDVFSVKGNAIASPKAIWNTLFAAQNPFSGPTEDGSRSARVQQFVNYLSALESRLVFGWLFLQFTVIGVQSEKFDNEKDLEAIRNAVLRYDIPHPVVNDGDMYLWRELGINSWPTFSIVGPNGKLLAQIAAVHIHSCDLTL